MKSKIKMLTNHHQFKNVSKYLCERKIFLKLGGIFHHIAVSRVGVMQEQRFDFKNSFGESVESGRFQGICFKK